MFRIYLKKNHSHTYSIILLLVCLLTFFMFWIQANLDYTNMINNGYVNSNSISFKIKDKIKPVNETVSNFIIMQYENKSPNIKHVRIKGNVKLPPINYSSKVRSINNGKVAIIGDLVDINLIPKDYKIIGIFNAKNSYRLRIQTWLISNEDLMSKNGTNFVFSTSERNAKVKLNKYLTTNEIKELYFQKYGTYSLKSNIFLTACLSIGIFFLISLSTMLVYIWTQNDRKLIIILFISGYASKKIIQKLIINKAGLYLCFSLISISFCIFFNIYLYQLWDMEWIYRSCLLLVYLFVIILMFQMFTVFRYTILRGGKQF